MDKNDLLKFCRFYKGERVCPFRDNRAHFWDLEKSWVQAYENKQDDFLDECIDDYTRLGLTKFEWDDDIPVSLKALLFHRYCKSAYSMMDAIEPFKEWYLNEYRK